jgi:hypothetical protein
MEALLFLLKSDQPFGCGKTPNGAKNNDSAVRMATSTPPWPARRHARHVPADVDKAVEIQ